MASCTLTRSKQVVVDVFQNPSADPIPSRVQEFRAPDASRRFSDFANAPMLARQSGPLHGLLDQLYQLLHGAAENAKRVYGRSHLRSAKIGHTGQFRLR